MTDPAETPISWPERIAAAVAGACFVAAVAVGLSGFAPALAADPEAAPGAAPPLDRREPLQPRDVTADQVFGNWVVRNAGIGTGLEKGERVAFRNDGTFDSRSGLCRFAILRAELTIACHDGIRSGDVEFVSDERILWRVDGASPVVIVPAD